MDKLRQLFCTCISKMEPLPGLLTRIAIGFIFIQSGWGKLHHLDKVVDFFMSLGIPSARIQAPFVAGIELVGGVLVLVGLFTRIASVPLIGTMVVAILTAKRADIHGAGDLLFMPEFLFIVLLLWLIVKGAGIVSVDALLGRRHNNTN